MNIFESILVHGDKVIVWVLTILGAFLVKLVVDRIKNDKTRAVIGRALHEVGSAVLFVEQTYVSALRKANADGKLTPEEREQAKKQALDVAKANLGPKGLSSLGRVVGVDLDNWLSTKVEHAVAVNKEPANFR